jgi:glycosyltransferase A (GT-A) superfamily protein (DUF2064 family)
MSTRQDRAGGTAWPCLVLMFKAPDRSKRRLADRIGASADELAACLLACVGEDIAAWPGATRYAPAAAADARWLSQSALPTHPYRLQGDGNLGARIAGVNRALATDGFVKQIFIGIDCPGLTTADLTAAADLLDTHDVVLAPARDGGVVLMGINGLWPDLERLPWSGHQLCDALRAACGDAGLECGLLPMRDDIDSVADLPRVRADLEGDPRAARRALCVWIDRFEAGPRSAAS